MAKVARELELVPNDRKT